ncbi:MAG: hypothetical protein P4L55_00175 [Syntrophobacteraceae bacterium]|nr:hypothetical protein [Syntrophobacteraceae bacterium]
MAVTHRGIAVAIFEEGEVSVWNIKGTETRKILDPAATLEMRLFALPGGSITAPGAMCSG